MQRRVEQYREQSVISALESNPGLSTISDIATILRRRTRLRFTPEVTAGEIVSTLHELIPEKVRFTNVHNNRGSYLYAPVGREPSAREQRVGSENLFVRTVSRHWYVGILGIRTCDL